MTANRTLLHQLWSKAVGTPRYDKEQWVALEEHLLEFERITKEQEALIKRLSGQGGAVRTFYCFVKIIGMVNNLQRDEVAIAINRVLEEITDSELISTFATEVAVYGVFSAPR